MRGPDLTLNQIFKKMQLLGKKVRADKVFFQIFMLNLNLLEKTKHVFKKVTTHVIICFISSILHRLAQIV